MRFRTCRLWKWEI